MEPGSSSKARPDALSKFLDRDGAHSTHAQLGDNHQSSTSQHPSFRQAAGSSSSQVGTDSDFGRFAQPSWSTSAGGLASAGTEFAAVSSSSAFSAHFENHQNQNDGADIQALLSSNTLTDAVSGDWAAELAAHQSQPWRAQSETTLPHDPLAAPSSAKGKGREQYSTPGDVSPITRELISSLSTLNVSDETYLRTLLAQSPEQAISDYFSRRSYADDVWGEPHPAVDAIMEKVKEGGTQDGADQAGAHSKAVRRLAMVARHLAAATRTNTTQPTATAVHANGLAPASSGAQRQAQHASADTKWADEFPLLAQHTYAPFAEYVPVEAPAHPAQNQKRLQPAAVLAQLQQAHARPLLRPQPAVEPKNDQRREDSREDEAPPTSALGPFSQYFDHKLMQMASLRGEWRRTVL